MGFENLSWFRRVALGVMLLAGLYLLAAGSPADVSGIMARIGEYGLLGGVNIRHLMGGFLGFVAIQGFRERF